MLTALGAIAPLAKMLFSTVDKAIPDRPSRKTKSST
jgi:hypothetical protein